MANDIKKKTDQDLAKELAEKRAALRSFRFGTAGSKSRNVKEGRGIKKDIARIMTEMNARVSPASAK